MADSEIDLELTPPAAIRVLMPGGHVEEMKLETYLAGAIAAEIGEKAPLEALKAQAVASRTYVVAAERHSEHHAHVCTTAHCQKWKRVDPVSSPDVFRALTETWGMVAVYNGNLIQSFFFEHCDGHTRNAEEMLIPAADYLRGVDCSCGHLNLKGHGVGMCKRGAIVMARRGATFAQILRHYYRGIAIGRMKAETPAAPQLEEVAPPRAPEAKKTPSPKGAQENSGERKLFKLQRPQIKIPSVPAAEPKPIVLSPKRPLLKRIVLPKKPPSEKPRAIEPPPPPIESSRATPVDSAPTVEKKEREDFVVVPRAVVPSKLKPVQPIQPTKPNGHDERAAEAEPLVIHVSRKKPEPAEPIVTATQALVVPSTQPTEPKETDKPAHVERKEETPSVRAPAIPPPQVEPVTIPPTQIEPVAAPAPQVEPVVVSPPASSPNVPETALPPLEGIAIKPMRRLHVDHLPGTRMIAGNLPRAGIVVTIQASDGKQTLAFSGTAPHYGEGGFETIIDQDGVYRVIIEGQTIEVKVQGETAFIHAG